MVQNETGLSRRQILGGAIAGTAAAAFPLARSTRLTVHAQDATEIEYWHPPHSADPDAEKELLQGQIDAFQAETPSIRVNLTIVPWADAYQKWTTAIASGSPPDVSISGSEAAIQFAAEGHLLPVSDIVEELGGEAAHWDTLPYFRYEDQYWQVPYIDGAFVLMYNPAMLSILGKEGAPATWQEVYDLAKAATKDDIYGLPLSFSKGFAANQAYMSMQSAWGTGSLSEDGKVQMTAPGMVELTAFYKQFFDEKLTPPDAVSWTSGDQAFAYLTNGKAPMVIGYGSRAQKVIDDSKANGIDVAVANMPTGPANRPGSYGATNGHMIFSKAKNPDAARTFIRFLHREENLIPWSKLTGWLPPLRAAAESPEINTTGLVAMRNQLTAGAVVRNGYAYGGHPANGQVEGTLIFPELLQEITVGGRDVEETLAEYQIKVAKLYGQA